MSEGNEVAVVEDTTAISLHNQFNLVDVDSAEAFMQNYLDLVDRLLDDTDYQQIGDKKAKKKSAWRKLATAFNISDEIVNEETVVDENNQIISSKFYVKATLPNGRSAMGVGKCSIFDKINKKDTEQPSNFVLRQRFSNAEHDVPSTAHTRAKSRAIADLIGAGEVSAEELSAEEPQKVQRKSRSSDNSTKTSAPKRRGRRRAAPKVDDEVIETKKVEENSSASNSSIDFDKLSEENEAIKTALNRIKDGGDKISKQSMIDELYGLYDLGTINIDEYYAAKELLEV